LIAIVGPSGVGKDSVMTALATAQPSIAIARRVITRAADAGGEDFEAASVPDFQARVQAGEFILHWGAHGLYYGVPQSVQKLLSEGRDVLANLSRSVLLEADQKFSNLVIVSLTASRAVLAKRLALRGRENAPDIAARLDRVAAKVPAGLTVCQIDNSGSLADTVTALQAQLYPVRA